MKKIFITFLMCCPLMCAAQSEWEAPVTNQNKETKEVKDTTKKSHKAEAKVKTLDTKDIKDWKYIQKGAVPEVDGKVVFTHDVDVNGKNAQEIYDIVYATLDSLTKKPEQINSSIALINRKAHSIVARYQEWLEFSKSFISLDRTKMSYIIIANCSDNKLHMTLERISYAYEEDRSTGLKTTAENWITDKFAVNKKGTKLIPGSAKFRKKTIDRKDQIFQLIDSALK